MKTMTIRVDLESEEWQEIRHLAIDAGRSLQSFVGYVLSDYLKHQPSEEPVEEATA